MIPPVHRKRRVWPYALLALAAVLYGARDRLSLVAADVRDDLGGGWRPTLSSAPQPHGQVAAGSLDAPLSEAAIRRSIQDARRLGKGRAEERLADRSRECHRLMRSEPSAEQLDRCAAFDYAVAIVAGRDPVHDQGPFSASAVTARQMAAASLLSSDYLMIESRLDRIRQRVELAFASPAAPSVSGGPKPPA